MLKGKALNACLSASQLHYATDISPLHVTTATTRNPSLDAHSLANKCRLPNRARNRTTRAHGGECAIARCDCSETDYCTLSLQADNVIQTKANDFTAQDISCINDEARFEKLSRAFQAHERAALPA